MLTRMLLFSPQPPHRPRSFKAALNVVGAEEQALAAAGTDGTVQAPKTASTRIRLRQTGPLAADRPHELLIPLPRRASRVWTDPRGSAEKIDEVFLKTCEVDLLLIWISVLALVYACLVKGPHGSVA